MKSKIFNIQHYSIHDGPGIRTTIFFKGCSLRCRWCSNPEGLHRSSEQGLYKTRCLGKSKCGLCAEACQSGALSFYRGKPLLDRKLCSSCMACADACPADAIKAWGREYSLEEVMSEILRDRSYYEKSGGGVTLSGGEPLLDADFPLEILKACRREGIHTCVETALHVDHRQIQKVLLHTDLFLADIKVMDPAVHLAMTGADNSHILDNLKWLASHHHNIILRIPVIPGVNDNQENMKQTADFILEELGSSVKGLQLLSYMRLGEEKYKTLDLPYQMKGLRFNRKAFQKRITAFADYFNSRGIHCTVGPWEKE